MLAVLTVYRLTRLVVADAIWEGTRDRLADWLNRRDKGFKAKVGYLITCPFCVSVYVGTAVWIGLWAAVDSLALPWLWWGGIVGGTALVYEVLPED